MKKQNIRWSWNHALIAVILVEVFVFGLANPKFLRPQLLFTGLNDFMTISIVSLFVTFVMITGGIDIQVEALVGLSSIIIGVLWQDVGLNIWLAALVGILVAGLCGLISGFFVAYCEVQAMVVTLGGSFLFSGLALLISTLSATEAYQGIGGFPESFKLLGQYKVFGLIPLQMILFLFLVIGAHILLTRTRYGRRVFLTGMNASAADYAGIHVRRVTMSTYVLSGLSAGFAGALLTSYLGTAKSDLGLGVTMNIITAVVLGGTLTTGGKGSVIGTALASIIIGLLRFGMPLSFGVKAQYLDIPIGILLIVVVVSRAIFGSKGVKHPFRWMPQKPSANER